MIAASEDPFFSHAEKVKSLIPNCRLAIIENGPLYLDRMMPKEYAEAILSYLKA